MVIFLTLLGLAATHPGEAAATHAGTPDFGGVALFLLREAGGGLAFGLAVGALGYLVLRTLDDHRLEILVTLALAAGGYALAAALHLSAPLAMVVIGLLIGNDGRHLAMSATTREHLDTFWELVDEVLNAVLFLLIGLELLLLRLPGPWSLVGITAAVLAVPVVLACRLVGIGLPVTLLRLAGRAFSPRAVRIITWGRSARWHLGGAGPVTAQRRRALAVVVDDLRRGGVLDPGAGLEPGARDSRRSPLSASGGSRFTAFPRTASCRAPSRC